MQQPDLGIIHQVFLHSLWILTTIKMLKNRQKKEKKKILISGSFGNDHHGILNRTKKKKILICRNDWYILLNRMKKKKILISGSFGNDHHRIMNRTKKKKILICGNDQYILLNRTKKKKILIKKKIKKILVDQPPRSRNTASQKSAAQTVKAPVPHAVHLCQQVFRRHPPQAPASTQMPHAPHLCQQFRRHPLQTVQQQRRMLSTQHKPRSKRSLTLGSRTLLESRRHTHHAAHLCQPQTPAQTPENPFDLLREF